MHNFLKMRRDLDQTLGDYERFCRKHATQINTLREKYKVEREKWPIPDFKALVRFVSIYGIDEGFRQFVSLRRLPPGVEDAVKVLLAATGTVPDLELARAYAAYAESPRNGVSVKVLGIKE